MDTKQLKKIVVLISGRGSNLQAIIDAIQNDTLPYCKIEAVISNRKTAEGLKRAQKAGIKNIYFPKMKEESREIYDAKLANEIKNFNPQLIVLAGWMRVLSSEFISKFESGSIINLHPALPSEFPGSDGIGDAFKAYKAGKIDRTGLMVHEVVEEVDAGKVLETRIVPIKENDSYESLKERVQKFEKLAIVNAIFKKLYPNSNGESKVLNVKSGKVRDIVEPRDDILMLIHSDRLSSFDRHICDVKGKGTLLCNIASWWFKNMNHNNHYLYHYKNVMIVKKCTPIPLEIVVRRYLTGSTNTSVWTHYNNGVRNYCGNELPDGLVKNQELPRTIITPTTKSAHDRPISPDEIIKEGILTEEEWNRISFSAITLFEFGQMVAKKCGLILVDTKYEFGRDQDGKIILIDEVHTPDSSRYWKLKSYDERFRMKIEPERLDKDVIREYLARVKDFDPYNLDHPIPKIPDDLKQRVSKCYSELYENLQSVNMRNL